MKYKYLIQVWFLHGNEEKEFEQYDIIAESDEKAIELAKEKHRWALSASVLKKEPYNEENVLV
jgi:hypothetical protein